MSNILVRDVAPNLKRDIEERAKASNRSLSDEVKHLIRVGLAQAGHAETPPSGESALDVMRWAFRDAQFTEEEHVQFEKALQKSRKDFGRPEPGFE